MVRRYRRRGLEAVQRKLLEGLTAAGVAGASVLEIGCGTGELQRRVLATGAVGIDVADGDSLSPCSSCCAASSTPSTMTGTAPRSSPPLLRSAHARSSCAKRREPPQNRTDPLLPPPAAPVS